MKYEASVDDCDTVGAGELGGTIYLGSCRSSGKSAFMSELPPSIESACPVKKRASSLHKSAQTSAMSPSVPCRRIGVQPASIHSVIAP